MSLCLQRNKSGVLSKEKVLHAAFDPDGSRLGVTTDKGIRIFKL